MAARRVLKQCNMRFSFWIWSGSRFMAVAEFTAVSCNAVSCKVQVSYDAALSRVRRTQVGVAERSIDATAAVAGSFCTQSVAAHASVTWFALLRPTVRLCCYSWRFGIQAVSTWNHIQLTAVAGSKKRHWVPWFWALYHRKKCLNSSVIFAFSFWTKCTLQNVYIDSTFWFIGVYICK